MPATPPPRHVVFAALMASWLFAGAFSLALELGLCHLDDAGELLLIVLCCLNFIGTTLWIDFHRTEGWRRKLAITICFLFLFLILICLLFPTI